MSPYSLEVDGEIKVNHDRFRCLVKYCLDNKLATMCGVKQNVFFVRNCDGFRFQPGRLNRKVKEYVEVVR